MSGLVGIPNGPHWAIVRTISVTIPGDERSHTNPGHGYPEHTDIYITYEAFTDEGAWRGAVEELILRRYVEFRALKVVVAGVKVQITVD